MSRGLTVVGSQPAGSIVTYATSVGSVAQDGEGRNGVFTSELLKNLVTPGIDIIEVFQRTGADVQRATGGTQIPAVYSQFLGKYTWPGKETANCPRPGLRQLTPKRRASCL